MVNLQTTLMVIFWISCIVDYVKGVKQVKAGDQCSCEQLIYGKECQYFFKCKHVNNTCITTACNELSLDKCYVNNNCAKLDGKCIDFISCSSHNAKNEEDCSNLHYNCYFDGFSETCKDIHQVDLGSCSQQLLSSCLIANEGLCIQKDGNCKEMTSCTEAKINDIQCEAAYPACNPNKDSDSCQSNNQCSEAGWVGCLFSKEKINSDEYLLCQQGQKGCVDFDPKSQTQETCARNSYYFYHWDGKGCSKCISDSNSLIITLSTVLLVFNI